MAYATVEDVTARWGRTPTDEETDLINVRLYDVERMIKRKIPDLGTRATDPDYREDLIQVEADAVLRLVRNPDGYLSETDGNYTYMLTQEMASGRLEILPEEWEVLGVVKRGFSILVPNPVMPT